MSDTLTAKIHTEIINLILQSPLNIDIIPDELERQMYEKIFEIVENGISKEIENNGGLSDCCERIFNRLTNRK